jgi:hypothetical protein
MSTRGGELIATNEPPVLAKTSLDAVVVEDGQSNGCLPDPACTDESDGCQVFGETDDLLDQLFAPETGPRWRGRRFSRRYTRWRCENLNLMSFEIADLA